MQDYAARVDNTHVRNRASAGPAALVQYNPADLALLNEDILETVQNGIEGYSAIAAQRQRMFDQAAANARNAVRADDAKANLGEFFFGQVFKPALTGAPDERLAAAFRFEYDKLSADYWKSIEDTGAPKKSPLFMVPLKRAGEFFGQMFEQLDKVPASAFLGPMGTPLVILEEATSLGLVQGPETLVPTSEQRRVLAERQSARYQQNLATMTDIQFADLDPEAQDLFLQAAGGDYTLASTFLLQGFLGNPENLDEVQQLQQDSFGSEEDVFFEQLKENQFRTDYSVLDLLDDWGRLTAGVAIGAGLLVSDEDVRSMAGDGKFIDILDEIATYDAKPSAVWGLEDTFLGLGVDLGLMTIFDPTTWLFAPAKGAAALRQFSSAENVMALVASRSGRQVMDDIVTMTGRGARSRAMAVGWMAPQFRKPFIEAVKTGAEADVKKIFTDAILLGGRPGNVDNLMWGQYMGNVIRATLDDAGNDVVATARRFTTAVPNRTSVELYGASFTDEVGQMFAALYGEDLTKFDAFYDKFMDGALSVVSQHSDELDVLRTETARLHEDVTLLSKLAEGDVRPLAEGFSLGGQSYDDIDSAIGFLDNQIAAGGQTGDDLLRLQRRHRGLTDMKTRIDGRSPADVKALGEKAVMSSEEYAAKHVTGEIAKFEPIAAPGRADGVGAPSLSQDGATLSVPLFRSEQMVGIVRLDYDAADKLIDFSITTTKAHKGDGLALYKAAQKAEPQLDSYWLATHTPTAVSQDGARFMQSVIRHEARNVAGSVGSRNLLKELTPALKSASTKLQQHVLSMKDLDGRRKLGEMLLKEYDAYVRTDPVLAKIPGLLDDKTGTINWGVLRGDAPWRRGRSRRIDPKAGADLPGPIKRVLTPNFEGMSVNLPVSPLDLQVARTLYTRILRGQARGKNQLTRAFTEAWNKWLRVKAQNGVGRWYEIARRFFMYDKVLRPATAMVAHLDEFYRIGHDYGVKGLGAWIERDVARIGRTTDGFLSRITAGKVSLGPVGQKAEDVLRRFRESVPREVSARQASLFQAGGEAFINIPPGSFEHLNAGRKLTDFFLEDTGFLASRQGRFDAWWDSSANWMKQELVQDHVRKVVRPMTKEDALAMYENVWKFLLGRSKDKARASKAWTEAVGSSAQMGRSAGVPEWLLDDLGPLPGWAKDPERLNPGKGVAEFFDYLFLQPQAGRQELIASLERTRETKRLTSLFESQGYNIVPTADLERIALGIGIPTPLSRVASGFLDERLLAAKIIPESYVQHVADQTATRAIDRIMYQWHVSSPAGMAARHVAPFGKPYADMWAYYMRNVFAKPVLRGHFIGANHPRISGWIDQAMKHYPVGVLPNRTTALISRVAALDMELENQEINIRLPWPLSIPFGKDINIEGVDLGPATFLPHEGENPFFSLIPGLGMLPMSFIDFLVPDPTSDKENWSAFSKWMSEELPAFLPTTEYGSDSPAGRFVGGGWISSILRTMAALDLRSTALPPPWNSAIPAPWGLMELIGDTQGSTQAVRSIKATLGQAEAWDELLAYGANTSLDEKALIGHLMEAYVYNAVGEAGESLLQKTLLRQVLPSRFNTDPTHEDIEEIWLKAGKQFPQLLSERDAQRLAANPKDPEALSEAAGAIRQAFYDLPVEERDLLIVQYPGLAAQLVSGWTWNVAKVDQIPELEGTSPFQHFPGQEGSEKFAEYKKAGWLIPRPAKDVFLSTLGYYFVVQDRVARNVYSEAVRWITENRPDQASYLNDGDPLNDQWRSNNVVAGPGGFPAYLREYVFDVPITEISEEARLLGITLDETYTGTDLIEAIQQRLSRNRQNPLHSITVGRYQAEAEYRSAAQDNSLAQIAMLSPGDDNYPDLWVDYVRSLKDEMRVASQFYRNVREDPNISEQITAAREGYANMAHAYPGFAWKTTWEQAFSEDFGPWPENWAPPTPPTGHPRDRGGFQPYVWDVVDGDSLEVSQNSDQGITFGPQLLPGPNVQVGEFQRQPKVYGVRLLGIRAPEYSLQPEEAETVHRELFQRLQQAPPGSVWLVPDDRFPEIDQYGRRLAWLWVNGEFIYDPDSFLPTDDIAWRREGKIRKWFASGTSRRGNLVSLTLPMSGSSC